MHLSLSILLVVVGSSLNSQSRRFLSYDDGLAGYVFYINRGEVKVMIQKENLAKKKWEGFNCILKNSHAIEIRCSDLAKASELADHFVATHASSNSVRAIKDKTSVTGICISSQESPFAKVVKRVAKSCAAMVVMVGTDPENSMDEWLSFIRYCAKQLPGTTAVIAVHNGNIVSGRRSVYQLRGFKFDQKITSLIDITSFNAIHVFKEDQFGGDKEEHKNKEKTLKSPISNCLKDIPESDLGWPLLCKTAPKGPDDLKKSVAFVSVVQWTMNLPKRSIPIIQQNSASFSPNKEMVKSIERDVDTFMFKDQGSELSSSQETRTSEDVSVYSIMNSKYENSSNSSSFPIRDLPQLMPGWPLLRISTSTALKVQTEIEDREVCSRSTSNTKSQISLSSNNIENPIKGEITCSEDKNNYCLPDSRKLPKELELVLKTKSAGCRLFSYKELKIATSEFSTENLIGEGGCSSVYKGSLPRGKPVAVKVLKSYKEAWNDFILEIDIVSSLKHKHITSLIGVCFEDNHIISVYDFLPKGSLEEHLHGNSKKGVLPWEARFKAAVVVAEALNYLHNECSPPVIHRDVKSSNILLTHKFQAQLSDFGLAIWGPTDSTYLSHTDVVGTFGYIAPEYFMHGRVSNKIDVYSFGVVLLELLSGRRPIGHNTLKGQENLVKWAKTLIDSRKLETLMDPKLGGKFDVVQMHKMVLAATLCISQSARLRPTVSQILQLLKGGNDTDAWVKSYIINLKESGDQEDDEIFAEFSSDPHLNLAVLDLEDDTTSVRCRKQKHRVKLKDYLKEPHG